MDTEDQMVVFYEQFQRDAVAYTMDAVYPTQENTSFLSRSLMLIKKMILSDPQPTLPKKESSSIKLKLSSHEAKA